MNNSRWYIARIKTGGEADTVSRLRRECAEVYNPVIVQRRKHRRYGVTVSQVRPLFPGYVFFKGHASWRGVLATEGVLGVLQGARGDAAFAPVSLPHTHIEGIIEQAAEGSKPLPIQSLFAVGDKIRLTSGPLSGYTGIVAEIPKVGKLVATVKHRVGSVDVHVPETMAEAA